ncbi:YciI family protein [Spirosoma luteolum]
MRYVIHAYDHTDSEALARRMAARAAHFDYVRQFSALGKFIMGGALLDPAGQMIGSMLVLELESQAELDTYLAGDPYVVQRVWNTIDTHPFMPANL